MKPNEFTELKKRIEELERKLANLTSAPDYDYSTAAALSKIIFEESTANPAAYDKAVNEAGLSSYNVADVPDGFFQTGTGKLIPFYNI